MSIRLNKAIKELNIGLQTAVEFLKKKNLSGDETFTENTKLTEEQYHALTENFKQDAQVRTEAEKLFQKKQQKEKSPVAQSVDRSGESLLKPKQQYKPLGKIDLDGAAKKSSLLPKRRFRRRRLLPFSLNLKQK